MKIQWTSFKLLNLRLIFYDDFFYTMELKEREST